MANKNKIVIIPGDVIGPEVIYEAMKILFFFNKKFNMNLYFSYKNFGANKWIKNGTGISSTDICKIKQKYNIIFFGILGDSRIPDVAHKKEILIKLKNELNLYVNIKSYLLFNKKKINNIITIMAKIIKNKKNVYSIEKIKRILYFAFRYAFYFNRKRITLIDDLNNCEKEKNKLLNIFNRIALKFPLIHIEYISTNNSNIKNLKELHIFDIIITFNVTNNIFLNLMSKLKLVSNSNMGNNIELFELTNKVLINNIKKNRANPINAIYTVANILKHLGKIKESIIIEHAIKKCLLSNYVIYSKNILTTSKIGNQILNYINIDNL